MRKSVILSFVISILFLPQSKSTDLSEFHEFNRLPNDIKVKVLSLSDKPSNVFLLSRTLHNHMKGSYIWARPDVVLAKYVLEAFDDHGRIIPDSQIMMALHQPSNLMLIKRLLWFSSGCQEGAMRHKVRDILTKHVVKNLFFYKDRLIEMSRSCPKISDLAMQLARGDFVRVRPAIHSDQVPLEFREYINEAELVDSVTAEHGIYRVWGLMQMPGTPHITTASTANGEEYIVVYPVEAVPRIFQLQITVLYRDNTTRIWPLEI